jgi:hypothetical protein
MSVIEQTVHVSARFPESLADALQERADAEDRRPRVRREGQRTPSAKEGSMKRYDWALMFVWTCIIFVCLTLWTLLADVVGVL